ncbi:MAG: tRNA (N6-threonylcarbamoyladenosine(37)-N6)-methyltransferase TrmO [Methanomassiliicoccales archaeon]|nr:MAG: tRNA (N6-threonylcarbamoyladenosine(37)-N6)-methyltransferase TrmO [Methanomassiliicoccales archaeon]
MLTIRPIGHVKNGINGPADFKDQVSEIVIDEALQDGLFRLERSDRIIVIFVFDRNIGNDFKLRLHPRGDRSIPEVGVFASRSPFRPNPIGVTEVELLSVKGNVLTVKGLDAFDGTPVLDIKPAEAWDGR